MRKSIMLTSVQDAEEFVNIAAKCNFNVKVKKRLVARTLN